MVDASQPGRLRHPAGGAAGRRDEHDRRRLLGRRGADQPDRRGLAGAGPPVTIESRERERGAHRRPLLRRRHEVGVAAARAGIDRRGLPAGQPPHLLRELGLERRGLRPVRPDLVRAVDSRAPARRRPPSRAARRAGRRAAEQRGLRGELTHRQARRAVLLRLGEHVQHPCARTGGESAATPPARAIRSAVWKPTPNTLVSSYGRPAHDFVRAARRSASRSAAPATRARAARAADAARGWSAARSTTRPPRRPAGC